MSSETQNLRQQISIIKKLIIVYQQLLAFLLKETIVIIHWTATSRDYTRFESIERQHKARMYPKSALGYHCAYNVLITGNSQIHQTRSYNERGEATSTHTGFHIDLCLTGDGTPTEGQIRSLVSSLDKIKRLRGRIILRGHKNYFPTECPGPHLTSWLSNYNKQQRSN